MKYNAENDVGYIRVTAFNEQTTGTLQNALEELREKIGPKLKGYVSIFATIQAKKSARSSGRGVRLIS